MDKLRSDLTSNINCLNNKLISCIALWLAPQESNYNLLTQLILI